MKYLDLSLKNPAQNLALDEALLEEAESEGSETLRFWESTVPFVVLGYSNPLKTEVYEDFCAQNNIPILRRASGGGTVLQGPGCLNYALILQQNRHPDFKSMVKTNHLIMGKIAASLSTLLDQELIKVSGHTDLTLSDLKFSGNAQRRKMKSFLFHGTFLIDFDLEMIDKTLRMPSKEPDYRKNRDHLKFVQNCERLKREDIKHALKQAWGADEITSDYPKKILLQLVEEKYSTSSWNQKF